MQFVDNTTTTTTTKRRTCSMIAPFSTIAELVGLGHSFAPELGFVKIVIVHFAFLAFHTEILNRFNLFFCLFSSSKNIRWLFQDDIHTVRSLLTIYNSSFDFSLLSAQCIWVCICMCAIVIEKKRVHTMTPLVFHSFFVSFTPIYALLLNNIYPTLCWVLNCIREKTVCFYRPRKLFIIFNTFWN